MPIHILESSESVVSKEDLIDDALRRLHAIRGTNDQGDFAEIPNNPEIKIDRQWIVRTCDEYKINCELPKISKSRQTLGSMAKQANKLSERFRRETNTLYVGTATDNPDDTPERINEKMQEIQSAQEELLAAADELDRIASWLNERAARWDGKNTGKISSAYAMAFDNPQNKLAEEAANKFIERRPDAISTSKDGDFYVFVGRLHEIAIGSEPDGLELHHACQDAVKTVRAKR